MPSFHTAYHRSKFSLRVCLLRRRCHTRSRFSSKRRNVEISKRGINLKAFYVRCQGLRDQSAKNTFGSVSIEGPRGICFPDGLSFLPISQSIGYTINVHHVLHPNSLIQSRWCITAPNLISLYPFLMSLLPFLLNFVPLSSLNWMHHRSWLGMKKTALGINWKLPHSFR